MERGLLLSGLTPPLNGDLASHEEATNGLGS